MVLEPGFTLRPKKGRYQYDTGASGRRVTFVGSDGAESSPATRSPVRLAQTCRAPSR